ncbi:MAG: hypothetical protein WCD76_00875, partial [Pyrinomonadaceae bacterium]
AHLATTARAWDRLPPLVSNRTGWAARLELWLKRHIKRATRWYAWEQINFNASVHHALRDALEALSIYERQLEKLSAEIRAASEARAEFEARNDARDEARKAETAALRDELGARLSALAGQFDIANEEVRAALSNEVSQLRAEQLARAEEIRGELRERDEHLRDEQRVCFKQLSLEAGETAVMQDRARRQMETRVERLEAKVAGDAKE